MLIKQKSIIIMKQNEVTTWQNNWIDFFVFPENPNKQSSEIKRVDELSPGRPTSPNNKRIAFH